jgi:conjugative relaxase-like TrwC/TraI family protein
LKNAKQYFGEHLAVGDYYEEGQKVSGGWFGGGAERLNLSGVVHTEEFLALCGNQHPQTGERLTQRLNETRRSKGQAAANRRIFYDFTFSPPKSVSILALVAEDGRLVEAHHRALQIALQEFEQFAAVRLRQKGARDYRGTQNIVAAQFTHDTSRALDPHLHTHCIVFNASFDVAEDRWKALENYDMLRARKYVENVYYHELAKDIRRFGYSICNHPRGDFEVQGVSAELCQRFSKRHKQIDEALAELLRAKPELDGTNLKAIRERLATAERARKMRDIGKAELRSLWQGQLTRAENEHLTGLVRQPIVAEPAPPS